MITLSLVLLSILPFLTFSSIGNTKECNQRICNNDQSLGLFADIFSLMFMFSFLWCWCYIFDFCTKQERPRSPVRNRIEVYRERRANYEPILNINRLNPVQIGQPNYVHM